LAAVFGLHRPVKDASTPEHWHYERIGVPVNQRETGGEIQYEEMKAAPGATGSPTSAPAETNLLDTILASIQAMLGLVKV